MNTVALLTLLATILQVDGTLLQVDVGSANGLRPGDSGSVFQQQENESQARRIVLGSAVVIAASSTRAVLEFEGDRPAQVADLVEFEIPAARPPTAKDSGGKVPTPVTSELINADAVPCVEARELPGSFSAGIECLEPGSFVEVLSRTAGWTLGRYSETQAGWLPSRYLEPAVDSRSSTSKPPNAATETRSASGAVSQQLAEIERVLLRSERARQDLLDALAPPSEESLATAPGDLDVGDARAEVLELRQQLIRADSDLAAAQHSLEEMAYRLAKGTVKDSETRLQNVENDRREAEIARRALKTEVESLSSESRSLRLRVAAAETSRDEAIGETERLRAQLAALQAKPATESQQSTERVEYLEAELAAARNRIRELEQSAASLDSPGAAEDRKPARRSRWKFWKRSGDAGKQSPKSGQSP